MKSPGWTLLVTVILCNLAFGQEKHDYPLAPMSFDKVSLQDQQFALKLHIPAWAGDQFVPGKLYHYVDNLTPQWRLKVNGQAVRTSLTKGFATINRTWKPGDTVELNIPMPIRYNTAIEQVEADRG